MRQWRVLGRRQFADDKLVPTITQNGRRHPAICAQITCPGVMLKRE